MPVSAEPAAAFLTAEAVVHLRGLARLAAPRTAALQRRFARLLAECGWDAPRRRALLPLSPGGAAILLAARRPVSRFLEQVEYHGRRLAKLNVAPGEVADALRLFDPLLDEVAGDRYRPAREQLHLATVLTLNRAFYEVREGETQAFFGLAQAEADAQGLEDLLQRFVRVVSRTLRARAGSIAVLPDGVPRELRRPRYLSDPARARPLLRDPALLDKGQSWWSCPVGEGAVMQLAFPSAYPWLPRELELLRAAAARCRRAMERVRLLHDLADRERQVTHLAAEARRAEEEERRRIGRELHDETGQSLLVLRLQLELLERECPPQFLTRLAELRGSVERNIVELRRAIAALSPDLLERLGLEAALRHLAVRFEKVNGVPVQLRLRGAGEVNGESAQVVYRVAQEALHNVARHSRASHVNLFFQAADKTYKLSVGDDGIGFDAETALHKPLSFGLAGMRERAALAGGTLKIRSAAGHGAIVTLELPRRSARTARYGKNSSTSD